MDSQPTIRTQISLTPSIKKAIEAKKRLTGESLSAYLRKAALIRLAGEEEEEKELKRLANSFVGAGKWKKTHPNWGNKKSAQKWLERLRNEWK
jgi:DNA repair photolyase